MRSNGLSPSFSGASSSGINWPIAATFPLQAKRWISTMVEHRLATGAISPSYPSSYGCGTWPASLATFTEKGIGFDEINNFKYCSPPVWVSSDSTSKDRGRLGASGWGGSEFGRTHSFIRVYSFLYLLIYFFVNISRSPCARVCV